MSPSKNSAADLLAKKIKQHEEEERLNKEKKACEDKEIADLKKQVACEEIKCKKAEEEAAARKKAQKDKEDEERRDREARSAQRQLDEVARARGRTMKAGGSWENAGKERKMGCKQRGTELAELEVKCDRCKKSGKKCMMPTKNARACDACYNSQQACVFPGNKEKPRRKRKAAEVDSDNKAGPLKRSNTMTGGLDAGHDSRVVELLQQLIQETRKTQRELPALIGDAVFRRMAGLSEATRWQELPLACLRDGRMEFASRGENAEEQLGEDLDKTMKTMEDELERVNRRLQRKAEKSGKRLRQRRISRRIDDEEDDEDQGPVAGGSGTRHSDDEGEKEKENEEEKDQENGNEKDKEDGMEDIKESQTQRE